MKHTKHFDHRSQRRGISADLIELVEHYGLRDGEKLILQPKNISHAIRDLDTFRKRLIRAIDKGGIVLVEKENNLITTYPLGN